MKKIIFSLFMLFIFSSIFANTDMVFVEGGEMKLGNSSCEDNLVHSVRISDFYMAKYLVTMGEFKKFLKETKLSFNWEGGITWEPNYLTVNQAVPNDNCPAQGMTWLYAILFCNWLSEKENLTPCYEFPNGLNAYKIVWNHKGNGYRLPTEAEWEYAAKGGRLSKEYKYPGSNKLDEINKKSVVSYEIGKMKPNELGIHDMGGLVSEWCYDWYDKKMWEWLPENNPCYEQLSMKKVNTKSLTKSFRGADWFWNPEGTYTLRMSQNLDGSSTIGIRLVRNNIETKQENKRNSSKTNYNEPEENKPETFDVTINTNGTVNINGNVFSKNGSFEIGEKKIRIGQNIYSLSNSNYTENGKINDSRVRLRSEPNLNCETLTFLNKDDNVKIYDRSDEMFKINDEDWYWYQVKTNDGTTGWVYGKYLDIEK